MNHKYHTQNCLISYFPAAAKYYKIQYKQSCNTTTSRPGYCSVTRTNNASDINPPLMNALNLLFEEYFEKIF